VSVTKILVVEDEQKMREGLKDNLEFEGYEVLEAGDGAAGLEKLLAGDIDLALLDVMLPLCSGFDVLKSARQKGIKTPVIMLTAKGEEIDRILGLELGADDYILKPFSLRELLARVKAVLRRSAPGDTDTIIIGHLSANTETHTATQDGTQVTMTAKEFDILRFLWQHRGETVSRNALLESVWGYETPPTTRTVDNFIVRLRQKIEDDPSHPRHILTVHGTGYRLVP
jgi:DNA-binding response OmpR family regulator